MAPSRRKRRKYPSTKNGKVRRSSRLVLSQRSRLCNTKPLHIYSHSRRMAKKLKLGEDVELVDLTNEEGNEERGGEEEENLTKDDNEGNEERGGGEEEENMTKDDNEGNEERGEEEGNLTKDNEEGNAGEEAEENLTKANEEGNAGGGGGGEEENLTKANKDGKGGGGREDLTKLLEPFNKEKLIDILRTAASNDPKVLEEIHRVADRDPVQRKLFVHGLGWEITTEKLREVFSQYGELENCNVVIDNATGKSKGYGFLLFKHRQGAQIALKEPLKKIESRMISCHLASSGPVNTSHLNSVLHTQQTQHPSHDTLLRKIVVRNVHSDIPAHKLHAFFSVYGAIEEGPMGFDLQTGKSKGFAIFIYKTVEGARKALEEPNKSFDGYQLYCDKATDSPKLKAAVAAAAAVPTSGGGGAAPALRNVPGVGRFNNPVAADGSFSAQGGVGLGAPGGAGFKAPDGTMAQQASAVSAAQLLGQGLFGGTFPFCPGITLNQAAFAVLAAAGQNPTAFGVNPAILASFNPALAAAMNTAPPPVASAAHLSIPQAMPGFGMGNPGYQNLHTNQAYNSCQGGPTGQPHQPRPHSATQPPVASASQLAMPGFGMGNPGYQNPYTLQANNPYQSGPPGQPHQPRSHSAAPPPVASAAQLVTQQAMPGLKMGNPGYQKPHAHHANNSYQSGPVGLPHEPRPHSAVRQMGGYGAR